MGVLVTATFHVGDAIGVMSKLPEKSVDLVLTSPPFWSLRSYLPADHESKVLEGGSEATPGEYVDWLIDVVEACDRVLAPHGSLCVELGDTYSGSGGAGGDYAENGLREGQPTFRQGTSGALPKSLSLIPELFRLTLVYGTNPLTGRTTERWRLRNVVRWVRPNPPVGALGDKFRPATSELMVFCKSAKRYFDLDAVREPYQASTLKSHGFSEDSASRVGAKAEATVEAREGSEYRNFASGKNFLTHAGAPPLDWWNIPPGGYSGTVMWTARKPVNPRESVGDIWRTTSADCPVHADQPDQAPTAPHDEPVFEDHPDRNHGKGANPAPKPLPGSAPIDPLPWPNLEDDTSGSPLPESTPAATPRSKASNKKGRVPATKFPDTASDRTPDRTDGTSTVLLSDVPHPDTPGNRTSLDGQDEAQPGSSDHIVDTSAEPFDEACTCSYWVAEAQSTSHYAVFPPELCIKPIKAMCPERVCRVCGEPSRRIVGEATYERTDSDLVPARLTMRDGVRPGPGINQHLRPDGANTSVVRNAPTLGFTDCGHNDYRPGMVLDPFVGSGTTLLVATGHGRDAIGIDLDSRNFDLALERVGPFILKRAKT